MRLAALLRAAGGGGGGGSWRERFECGGRDVARWFPGHMARGTGGAASGRRARGLRRAGTEEVATMPLSSRRAEGHEEEPARRGRPAGGARRPHILPSAGPRGARFAREGLSPPPWSLLGPAPSTRAFASASGVPETEQVFWCGAGPDMPAQGSRSSGLHMHIPLSGRNPVLKEVLGIRPHLLVLNKMDLADLTHKSRILELLEEQGLQHVVFTDCLTDENIKKLVPILTGLIKNSQRYQRAENVDNNIMVIGVPNVGKSSVINSLRKLHLRKGKATPVGGAPGITKALLTRIQVSEKPLMYLLDTPGVLSPQIESIETGLKLALCGAIRDHLVGVEVIADYLLYVLNQQQQFSYVERYGLSGPCDEVESVLRSIARHLGKVQKVQVLTGTGLGADKLIR